MTLQERLGLENQILQHDGLSQFQVYQSNDEYSFFLWGTHRTSSANAYEIWSPIPSGYPSSRPRIYVRKPNPLRGYSYEMTINAYDVSHNMHTLSNGPNGEVQICHWRDERWHSGITLNKVMIKVVLWLEAYEQHLSSGDPITNFVGTMY
jgi:hypothetical protein